MRHTLLAILLVTGSAVLFPVHVNAGEEALRRAIEHPSRTASFTGRDQYRHPFETLAFFDIQPGMTVVEIWPGAGGWYTEILGPYLKDEGKLYAAQFNADSSAAFYRDSRQAFMDKLAADETLFGAIEVTTFNPPDYTEIAPPGSADRVITFRNIHNFYMRGGGDERVVSAFEAMFRALKPGGILGIVEHRLPSRRPRSDQESSGYMHEEYVVAMVEKAGFEWLASSGINANPDDNTGHPAGVWTLPPTLRLGEADRETYLAIGESDRMTLTFRKPL